MERLAWVEILDRHGDVAARHPVYKWPFRVGRAYSNDLVLDDPHVAASHLEINQVENGNYQLTGLNTINGITIDSLRGKQTDATVSTSDLIRIGVTQLRMRPINFSVSAEKPMPRKVWMRSWPVLIVGVIIFHLLHLLMLWLNYDRAESYTILVAPLLADIPMLLIWVGFWTLIGRVISGRANFVAHAIIATLGVALLLLLNGLLYAYIDFSFNTGLITDVFTTVVEPVIIGGILYQHICLVSRVNRRRLVITIAVLMAALVAISYIIDKWTGDDNMARMSFSRSIGPPSMLLISGKSTDEFLAAVTKVKFRVDKMKAEMDKEK